MKKILLIATIFISALTLQAQTTLDTAVNFTVKDTQGNNIELFSILDEGKIVVIDFFSTAWGSCQIYAPDLQAAYTEFGCNEGNVFFIGIDKGNTNDNVIYFDSVAGIQYPGVSGMEGGGNLVHLDYNVQATPTIVVITPDKVITTHQINPPNTQNVVDSVLLAGGILQSCTTSIPEIESENSFSIGSNPVKSKATINLNIKKAGHIEVGIYNLTGQKVFSFGPAYYHSGNYSISADLSKEQNGLYFAQIKNTKGEVRTKKIMLSN